MNGNFQRICFVIIIVLLAIIAVPAVKKMTLESKEASAEKSDKAKRDRLERVAQEVQIFAMRHKSALPDSLAELVSSEDGKGLKSGDLIDTWGTPYVYTKTGRKYKVISAGPDCVLGTIDDLTSE